MDRFEQKQIKITKMIVHAGSFHADDVFCVATAKIINQDAAYERLDSSRHDLTDMKNGIVMADIGGGILDHHQNNVPERDDGIMHCAFSRLWLYAGVSVIRQIIKRISDEDACKVCRNIYDGLIRTIAIEDNGISMNPNGIYSIGMLIEHMMPNWNETDTIDERFEEAVKAAEAFLICEIRNAYATIAASCLVEDACRNMKNGIIVLEKTVPWEETVCAYADALMVIFPSNRGGYCMQLVPVEAGSFDTRISVPESWKGKRDKDAQSEMDGMYFCHKSGFLSCFETEEQAINAAAYVTISNQKK